MKFLGLVSIALSAVYRESQYDDPLLHFLDRIDLQEYQFNDQLYDNYYDADIMAPAEYIQDQENYEGEEGNWVVQGYRKITVPYFEMADGELLTWQEYEPMFDESKFYADKSFREYVSDFEYERTNVQEYEDSTERVPQAMPIKNFFSRVGRSIKRGFQNAGSKIKKGFQKALPTLRRIGSAIGRVAQVALPIMKFIPGPVGLIARGVDMAINVGKGIHAAVQARRNGGSVRDAFKAFGGHAANAAMGMVPGGKFLRMGKGLIGGAAKGVVGNLLRGGGKGVGNLLRGGAKQILGKRGKGFAGVAKTVMNAAKSKALNRFRGAVNTVRQQQQQKSQQRPAQRAPPRRPAPRRRR